MMVQSPIIEQLGWSEGNLRELQNLGYAFFIEGKYPIASLYYETLTRLNPDEPYNHQLLGAIYLEANENELAVEALNKALQLDPSHVPTKLNKTKALFALEKREEALALAKEVKATKTPKLSDVAEALILGHS
jgi:tetratricopeptide (TPR) repeat protein